MPEHIDEDRRDDLIVRVDDALRGQPGDRRPDVGDAITNRCDAAPIPRIPGSVDDPSVADQNVVLRCRRPARLHRRTGSSEGDR
jgi:hypothetical protein